MAATTTAEVSVPDFKLMRKVMSKLDDVFDEVTRRYRSGYSDDKVAAELDLSSDFIINMRRGAYGELAENPDVSKLRDDITLMGMGIQEQIEKLQKALDGYVGEFNKRIAHLGHHKAAG